MESGMKHRRRAIANSQSAGMRTELTEKVSAYGDTFVTHRKHSIFYNYNKQHCEWFFIVYRTNETVRYGYPCLGSDWHKTKETGIDWGKALIDSALETPKAQKSKN